jgi:3-methyl-2-oxobutanoate hydroxymethyltransferase
MKRQGERIAAVTAYDYPTATLVDEAGVDVVLVGDSMASVVLGHETTLPVTLEEMLTAVRSVRRGLRRALLVADLPFGYCHGGRSSRAVDASIRYLKAGAEAVKLEGGSRRRALVRELVDAEVPVMGHLGLTPQSIHGMGGYRVQGKTAEEARRLLDDAFALVEAGAFAIVLEGMPAEVAARITEEVSVPTIGIGAGSGCDGQILVLHDLLGLTVPPPPAGGATGGRKPRFVREYLDLRSLIVEAVRAYAGDVKAGSFPAPAESYRLSEAETGEIPHLRAARK